MMPFLPSNGVVLNQPFATFSLLLGLVFANHVGMHTKNFCVPLLLLLADFIIVIQRLFKVQPHVWRLVLANRPIS